MLLYNIAIFKKCYILFNIIAKINLIILAS